MRTTLGVRESDRDARQLVAIYGADAVSEAEDRLATAITPRSVREHRLVLELVRGYVADAFPGAPFPLPRCCGEQDATGAPSCEGANVTRYTVTMETHGGQTTFVADYCDGCADDLVALGGVLLQPTPDVPLRGDGE